jgi:hypothetical protein
MGTIVDPAWLIIDYYRLLITKRDKQTDEFRLPPSSDYRLPIVANNRKFAYYRYFRYISRHNRQADRQADRQAGRQTDRQIDRQADMRVGRQADRQTDRQVDRQTGR